MISREASYDPTGTALRLLSYCRMNDWAGYDPYDALNSRIFQAIPIRKPKLARLILIQGVKRCPINLRPLLFVPKTQNPKGLALFLSAMVLLKKRGLLDQSDSVSLMANKLMALRSPGRRYSCWGYDFDWQQRSILVPKFSPNIICSTFAANALIDAREELPESIWLSAAAGTAEFILKDLFRRGVNSESCFRYTLEGDDRVHNANLLGAAFLCRIGQIMEKREYIEPALEAARYSVSRQHSDGSWDYGEASNQRWIDNFHTGFNLVALRNIFNSTAVPEFANSVCKGFDFYRAHFFREDGAPRYFHDRTYPLDIHSVAQSLITLIDLQDLDADNIRLARMVLDWAITNMWDGRGFFYWQKRRLYTNHISFMRWSQAWMLFAIVRFLESAAHSPIT